MGNKVFYINSEYIKHITKFWGKIYSENCQLFGSFYGFQFTSMDLEKSIFCVSQPAQHRGVALIWTNAIDNFVTPLDTIDPDRIVGIKCAFPNCRPLFILAVYLPSSNHAIEEFKECLEPLGFV